MRAVLVILALVGVAAPGSAQRAKIDSLLDRATAAQVNRLIDSARALKLPGDALAGVALEGASRHADPEKILAAVQGYFGNLMRARTAIGAASTEAELTAGAGAILSGATPAQLMAIRKVQPGRTLTLPLVVLADLASRGVPVDTATRAVYVSLARGARDEDLSVLRRLVEQDILAGAAPGSAALSRLVTLPGITPADVRRLWTMPRNPSLP